MPLDPQLEATLSQMPAWPPVRTVPLDQLRESVRTSSMMLPAPAVSLASINDRKIPGPDGEIPIRVYTPEGTGPFPVVVYFHGGGFVVGDLDTQDLIARGLAGGSDSVVVSVDYRLAPEHKFPAAPLDAFAALQWVAANASDIGGDPARLAVAGDSAGGILANVVALMARDAGGPKLAAQVNWYGAGRHPLRDSESVRAFKDGPLVTLDDAHFYYEVYLENEGQFGDFRACPAFADDHRGLAPAFMASAECDVTRDELEAYAETLKAAGVEVEAHRYAGMIHGFVSWSGFVPTAKKGLDDACDFLKRRFAAVS